MVGGKVVFIQEKKRRNGAEMTPDQMLIRNHDNGWIFALPDADSIPQSLRDEAIKAVAALGLDFGAVDCVLERNTNLPYILEVNTAPGLRSPSLINAYLAAFRAMLGLPQQM